MPRFEFEVQRRFSDVDLYGHINNVQFLVFFEDTRAAWQRLFPAELPARFQHIVVRQEIDYSQMVTFTPDPLIVQMWISKIGRTSYATDYRVLDDGSQVATGRTIMVFFDEATGRAAEIPDYMRTWLATFEDAPTA